MMKGMTDKTMQEMKKFFALCVISLVILLPVHAAEVFGATIQKKTIHGGDDYNGIRVREGDFDTVILEVSSGDEVVAGNVKIVKGADNPVPFDKCTFGTLTY